MFSLALVALVALSVYLSKKRLNLAILGIGVVRIACLCLLACCFMSHADHPASATTLEQSGDVPMFQLASPSPSVPRVTYPAYACFDDDVGIHSQLQSCLGLSNRGSHFSC